MQIDYQPKTLYGRKYFYPMNDNAKTLCKLINRPTLTLKHLDICKQAGWPVNCIQNTKMKKKP